MESSEYNAVEIEMSGINFNFQLKEGQDCSIWINPRHKTFGFNDKPPTLMNLEDLELIKKLVDQTHAFHLAILTNSL